VGSQMVFRVFAAGSVNVYLLFLRRPMIWLRGIVILDCAHAIGSACRSAMLTTVTFALTS